MKKGLLSYQSGIRLDSPSRCGIMSKSAAGRRLASWFVYRSNRSFRLWGGCFFFTIITIKVASEINTMQNWNSSSYGTNLISTTPFCWPSMWLAARYSGSPVGHLPGIFLYHLDAWNWVHLPGTNQNTAWQSKQMWYNEHRKRALPVDG